MQSNVAGMTVQRLFYNEETDLHLVSNFPLEDVLEVATVMGADFCSLLIPTGFMEDKMYLIRFDSPFSKMLGRQIFYNYFGNLGTMVS